MGKDKFGARLANRMPKALSALGIELNREVKIVKVQGKTPLDWELKIVPITHEDKKE